MFLVRSARIYPHNSASFHPVRMRFVASVSRPAPVATSGALKDSGVYAALGSGQKPSKLPNVTRKE